MVVCVKHLLQWWNNSSFDAVKHLVLHWFSEMQICAFPHSNMTDWHLQTLISDCLKKQHPQKNLGHHPMTDECRNKQWNRIWLKTTVGDVLQANAFQLPKWQENSRSHNEFICFSLNTDPLWVLFMASTVRDHFTAAHCYKPRCEEYHMSAYE